jgi:Malectin domain
MARVIQFAPVNDRVTTPAVSETERSELAAIRGSSVLARSPSLLKLFDYIVRKYVEGETEHLKEYSIAVDAFGRAVDFDPKLDSIVRVEVYRLRKKLKQYYATEGADRTFEIVLEPGQYVPKLRPRVAVECNAELKLAEEDSATVVTRLGAEFQPPLPDLLAVRTPLPAARRFPVQVLSGTIVLTACVLFLLLVSGMRRNGPPTGNPQARIRIRAGGLFGGAIIDPFGEVWTPDQWFHGGEAVSLPGGNVLPAATDLLRFERRGDFDYAIPLSEGSYELRLYFAGRLARATDRHATRRFSVFANGLELLDALDPSATRETPEEGVVRVFRDITAGKDRKLHLSFRSAQDPAFVSGIELTPGIAGAIRPVRIVAKQSPYTDRDYQIWAADRYVTGGNLAMRTDPVGGDLDPNLFSGERYGTFTYKVPVPSGRYRLTLFFAETWFGRNTMGGGGAGSRRFDVDANGVPLLKDFDILREAGGSYRGLSKTFDGLMPDSDGYINLSFLPRINNACINAIELSDEIE